MLKFCGKNIFVSNFLDKHGFENQYESQMVMTI